MRKHFLFKTQKVLLLPAVTRSDCKTRKFKFSVSYLPCYTVATTRVTDLSQVITICDPKISLFVKTIAIKAKQRLFSFVSSR